MSLWKAVYPPVAMVSPETDLAERVGRILPVERPFRLSIFASLSPGIRWQFIGFISLDGWVDSAECALLTSYSYLNCQYGYKQSTVISIIKEIGKHIPRESV